MTARSYTLDPACSPDTWYCWVGPDSIGSAAVDSSTKSIRHIGYQPIELYRPDQFRAAALEIFGSAATIRRIIVAFRFDQWAWIPTADSESSDVLDKWIRPFFPARLGHTWIEDRQGPPDATAWVEVPTYFMDQLKALSSNISFRHATGFANVGDPSTDAHLELALVGKRCWFSFWDKGRFLYGQPHIIEQPADLLYVLGILFEKFEVRAADTRLSLIGEWGTESDLLRTLRDRFKQIEGRDAVLSDLRTDLPGHWFTPLADLLSCE